MPYSYKQCQAFGAKARSGEKVPSDWQVKCKGVNKPKTKKAVRKTTMKRR